MNTRKSISILALALTMGGGMLATSAFAELPNKPGDVKVMDTNNNGKIEKDEYLAYMSKLYDKAAGSKGYCTYEEIKRPFNSKFNFNSFSGG